MPDNAPYGSGGITVGPDGRIWTTTNNSITRVDYWRTMQSFGALGQSEPAIAAGPDGNLWFTEFSAGAIGRLNPATGKVDSFPDPSGGQPINIIAGPDGNMWFTERSSPGNIIGRISMSGVIKEFSAKARTNFDDTIHSIQAMVSDMSLCCLSQIRKLGPHFKNVISKKELGKE